MTEFHSWKKTEQPETNPCCLFGEFGESKRGERKKEDIFWEVEQEEKVLKFTSQVKKIEEEISVKWAPVYAVFAPNMFYSKAADCCSSKVITKTSLGAEGSISKHSCWCLWSP